MKTILVPTDFSPVAKNAAEYALGFARQISADKIVLYHAYQPSAVGDPLLAVTITDFETMKKAGEDGLAAERDRLLSLTSANIAVDLVCEMHFLVQEIDEICQRVGANYIVMGITGGGALEETLIGSNTLAVSKHTKVPLMIVPANAKYQNIHEVMMMSDLKDIATTTPEVPLRKLLDDIQPKVYVMNFDPEFRRNTEEGKVESMLLDNIMRDYPHEYVFSLREDFADAINEFAEEHEVDMVITFPKKHGWFESLLHPSHTKELAFHSELPVMVMHG